MSMVSTDAGGRYGAVHGQPPMTDAPIRVDRWPSEMPLTILVGLVSAAVWLIALAPLVGVTIWIGLSRIEERADAPRDQRVPFGIAGLTIGLVVAFLARASAASVQEMFNIFVAGAVAGLVLGVLIGRLIRKP